MRRGINLGGVLDGGDLRVGERQLDAIGAAGFDTVRLPVRWDAGAFARVDRVLALVLASGLRAIVDVHHHAAAGTGHGPPLVALWDRIARHYAAVDGRLAFELLNEPHEPLTAAAWNALLAQALAVVRAVSPEREVIAGPVRWNTVGALPDLVLPADPHLTVTVHYYSPFRFTHQGADWLDGADGWRGTRWGSAADRARVRTDLEGAAAWAAARGRPLLLGEFGTHVAAHPADRAAWIGHVRTEAERLGLDWVHWDLATDFGVYDLARGVWDPALLAALLG